MGRRNQTQGEPELLLCRRVKFVDGDYDAGGAYWGGGAGVEPLWCGFSPDDTKNDEPIMIFVRAANLVDAKLAVLGQLDGDPGWGFR